MGFKFNPTRYDYKTKILLKNWEYLKNQKEYEKSDKLRKELQEKNILP
jgi:cysteinyl-tRNA synthetase